MAALDFPASPTVGQHYPAPSVPGIPTYVWDGEKWTTIGGDIGALVGATVAPLAPVDPAVVGTSAKYAREDHQHPTNKASAAEYLANSAPNKALTPFTIWAAAAAVTLTDAATVTPDLSTGSDFGWSLGATGRTLANPINGKPGQKGSIFIVSGSGSITSWGSAYKFPLGVKPTLTGTNVISYVVAGDGLTMYCSALTGMA